MNIKTINFIGKTCVIVLVLGFLCFTGTHLATAGKPEKPSDPVKPHPDGSPASLDMDTGGCATVFNADLACVETTYWTVDNTYVDLGGGNFRFDVTVTEYNEKILSGSGTIVLTNSGELTVPIANVVASLEQLQEGKKNRYTWVPLLNAIQNNPNGNCDSEGYGYAVVYCEEYYKSDGSYLYLGEDLGTLVVPPSTCIDAVVIPFEYEFDIFALDLEPGEPLRISVMVTFDSGASRGGTCSADVDCDGDTEKDVRTVQQRYEFYMPVCDYVPECYEVHLEDTGAVADDDSCVTVISDTLNETIEAHREFPWEVYTYSIYGSTACVCEPVGIPELPAALPDTAYMKVKYPYNGGPAYFPNVYIDMDEDSVYELDVLGWCGDNDYNIYEDTQYKAAVFSSYEPLPSYIIEKPENLDLVNWIINQDFIGKPAVDCAGEYTYGDVQLAIWDLIEDYVTNFSGLGPYSQDRANEIKNAAIANGEGYEPGCDELVALILAPFDPPDYQTIIAQVILGEYLLDCEECMDCGANVLNTASLYCIDDPFDPVLLDEMTEGFAYECVYD